MIIVLAREGQLCNQIYTISAAYTIAIENNEKLIIPVVSKDLIENFPNLPMINNNYRIYNSTLSGFFVLISKIVTKIKKSEKLKKYCKNKHINIFYDWKSFFDYDLLNLHRQECSSLFDFSENVKNSNKRTDFEHCIIAVHMRRGDYKTFCNGKYYYSEKEYVNWMTQLSRQNDNILFYLFSNETIDESLFTSANIKFKVIRGDKYSDLYSMSQCDYIMGPPSSFSVWAARFGNKKLLVLERGYSYTIEDFGYNY